MNYFNNFFLVIHEHTQIEIKGFFRGRRGGEENDDRGKGGFKGNRQ